MFDDFFGFSNNDKLWVIIELLRHKSIINANEATWLHELGSMAAIKLEKFKKGELSLDSLFEIMGIVSHKEYVNFQMNNYLHKGCGGKISVKTEKIFPLIECTKCGQKDLKEELIEQDAKALEAFLISKKEGKNE